PVGDRSRDDTLAGITAWLSATSPGGAVGFAVTDPVIRETLSAAGPLLMAPLVVDADGIDTALAAGPIAADLTVRTPSLRGRNVVASVCVDLDGASTVDARLRIVVTDDTVTVHGAVDDATAALVAAGLEAAIEDPAAAGTRTAADDALIDDLNDVVVAVAHDRTIDARFRARAASQPDAPAVSADGRTISYASLATRVDHLSAALADAGVGRGDLVGIALRRSIDMVAATLAVMGRGAAYVPLDPTYPADRVLMMVDDAGLAVVFAETDSSLDLRDRALTVIHPGEVPEATAEPLDHDGDDLAYVIYTSGSTGRPKGVQLEHHNVANFFDAMDEVVDPDPSGVWLAVTSLSFDISVLELLWTLTRGLHVVVKAQSGFGATPAAGPRKAASFSLMYFGAGEAIADNGYEFVRESATWADRNGFEACWFPERHFHDFGAPYPNPSVIGSAVAALTEQIQIRAGSVVLPLHNPVRVAEEWAVVDNLSQGRVGLSFAPGWQINDFVLNPGAWETARQDLAKNMDIVRALWRGETIDLPGPRGDVATHTYPRPVQDDLEMWLTSAGSRGSFEAAGRMGVNVLTHLLGQSLDDLGANIDAYRAARRDAGHDGDGHVTVMVHTYLADDGDEARETAREPLKSYLGTAAGLLKNIASEFPTFRGSGEDADEAFRNLTDDEMGQLLDLAANRYLGTAGLFGTVEDGVEMATALTNVGADEIACLIDFGVAAPQALGALDLIAHVRDGLAAAAQAAPAVADETVAALVERYGVSHFQCTPSLAEMILAEPADRAALGTVGHMLVGGEALPTALATELRSLLPGRFTNMYGPTETTIWSLCHDIDSAPSGSVPIGRPIRNNPIAILDPAGREVAVGVWGELFIGGEGVARGYKDRPELTAERFIERDGKRIYATGDRARVHPSGIVEFGGRGDGQVKIRGHRIELGEIESVLDAHPAVARSVVTTPPDQPSTLVAFVTTDAPVEADALLEHVAASLPEAMVPAALSFLDALPFTPNGKVDRKALPFASLGSASSEAPTDLDGNEAVVADVWNGVLGRTPGLDDNFFDVGGHSLRAVAVFRQLADRTDTSIALTDVFRFPTIRSFAAHLDGSTHPADGAGEGEPVAAAAGTDRGAKRRAARQRRGARG
ncbi:MAG: MupA/Atu3671 family FMN-dependent luciferase-like monooxygenase, partial [Actinomycetota bacterium]